MAPKKKGYHKKKVISLEDQLTLLTLKSAIYENKTYKVSGRRRCGWVEKAVATLTFE